MSTKALNLAWASSVMLCVDLETMVASTHSVILAARYWKGDHWPTQGPALWSLTPLPHTTQGRLSAWFPVLSSQPQALCLTASCHCSGEGPTPLQSTPRSWPRPTKPSRIQHSLSLSCIPYSSFVPLVL